MGDSTAVTLQGGYDGALILVVNLNDAIDEPGEHLFVRDGDSGALVALTRQKLVAVFTNVESIDVPSRVDGSDAVRQAVEGGARNAGAVSA